MCMCVCVCVCVCVFVRTHEHVGFRSWVGRCVVGTQRLSLRMCSMQCM